MANRIPNLWPDEIRVDILTPVAILRYQAGQIEQMTKSLLEAEVSTTTSDKKRVLHALDVIAPVMKYRHRILTAKHDAELVYPVTVESDYLQVPDNQIVAFTEEGLMECLRNLLGSGDVRSLIQSLIARSNELTAQAPAA